MLFFLLYFFLAFDRYKLIFQFSIPKFSISSVNLIILNWIFPVLV